MNILYIDNTNFLIDILSILVPGLMTILSFFIGAHWNNIKENKKNNIQNKIVKNHFEKWIKRSLPEIEKNIESINTFIKNIDNITDGFDIELLDVLTDFYTENKSHLRKIYFNSNNTESELLFFEINKNILKYQGILKSIRGTRNIFVDTLIELNENRNNQRSRLVKFRNDNLNLDKPYIKVLQGDQKKDSAIIDDLKDAIRTLLSIADLDKKDKEIIDIYTSFSGSIGNIKKWSENYISLFKRKNKKLQEIKIDLEKCGLKSEKIIL